MHKYERQNAIVNIISGAEIKRQDELARLLRSRGFDVTQASVSRDLDELGVVKIDGVYARSKSGTLSFPLGPVSIATTGGAIVVAKCASGLASAAAVRIDAAAIEGVAGTIAGDDTIFVALEDAKRENAVVQALHELFAVAGSGRM